LVIFAILDPDAATRFSGLGQLALQMGGGDNPEDEEEEGGSESVVVGDTWVADADSDCESVDSEVQIFISHLLTVFM
jgi:hypothetical protein